LFCGGGIRVPKVLGFEEFHKFLTGF
jgi:hypothetical protein